MLRVIFQVFWSKSRVLGQIGRSGKVLGFISSNFGPDPTAGCLLKGNNRGAIIIIIIPDVRKLIFSESSYAFLNFRFGMKEFIFRPQKRVLRK